MATHEIDLKKATLQELREHIKGMNVEDGRAAFAAALDTSDLDVKEAAILAVAQRIYLENSGCDTPIEEFLSELLTDSMYWPLTLQRVQDEVKELKLNWNDALRTARKYYRDYPELVAEPNDVCQETCASGH